MYKDRPSSIREAYIWASSFLKERGVPEAAACADLLLQHVLGWDRTKLLLHWSEPFPAEILADWQEGVARKAAGEPVQYIIGEQEFYGLSYHVTPAVLIPRPETELLVEEIIRLGNELWPGQSPLVADIGTGSGAIAVALAAQCPQWQVWATDLSPAALEIAEQNGNRHARNRIQFLHGDLLAPLIERQANVDILVSNPPYIPSADMTELQQEVGRYEPHTALHGGEDGLDYYRRLLSEMERLPSLPALVGFEVGQGQARIVERMFTRQGDWSQTKIISDLAGIERHVFAWR